MSFSKWREKEKEEIALERANDIRDWKNPSPTLDDRLIQKYNNYETHLLVKKTHWLVLVTILLALTTTILSFISIFIK